MSICGILMDIEQVRRDERMALPPTRPNMPIDGRTLEQWAYYYHDSLFEWFYDCHKYRPGAAEWEQFICRQFDYQITRDTTL